MDNNVNSGFAEKIKDFRLPRYKELPNIGLYLEQVVKYINGIISPLGCTEITSSMVSNYVKKEVIPSPVKKQYYADQIGYLIFVSLVKSVISMEQITKLIEIQKTTYPTTDAYDYFCQEFENVLTYIAGMKNHMDSYSSRNSIPKSMLRSVIIAATHILYVNDCFNNSNQEEKE